MSPTGNPHRTRHTGRGTTNWDRLTGTNGELTLHGEHTAELAEQDRAGYWDPPAEFDVPAPTHHGWAPDPYPGGGLI